MKPRPPPSEKPPTDETSGPRHGPPQPYLTKAPWEPFSAHEFPREKALPCCPSPFCRRAKACRAAYQKTYCLRTHESLNERRRRRGDEIESATEAAKARPRLTFKRAQYLRHIWDLKLDQVKARNAAMAERWKAGELDHLYGPYKPQGVLKHPPIRQYTE
jgi:hypothetical protein